MKIVNTSAKTPFLFVGAIILAILAYLAFAYVYKLTPFASRAQPTTISDTVKNATGAANNGSPNSKDGINSSSDGLPNNSSATTSDQVPVGENLTVSITDTSQSNGQVKATATTSGTGTCVFLYTTDGDKPVTRQTTVDNNTCSSSIPEIEFSKLGSWNLKVTYYANNQKVEATKDVAIH